MKLAPLITDNITELLVKIIEFTQTRQKLITQNINNIHTAGFIPKDLAVEEFSYAMSNAIDEHILNHRLLLQDTDNVKFGSMGSFEVRPVIDEDAKELLEKDVNEYLEFQINKLLENSLNQRIAAELMKQKPEIMSIFE